MDTCTIPQRQILPADTTEQTVPPLQQCLTTLIDLALQLKQAHWNLVGARFLSFHVQLDDIIASARNASDEIAERIAALGVAAEGRPDAVAEQSSLDHFPPGRHDVPSTVTLVADRLQAASGCLRASIKKLAEGDPVSEDLLIGVCADLEKHLWMVQSQEEV